MKAKASELSRFLGAAPPRLFLFHGADEAGSRAAAVQAGEALGGERTRLDAATLKSDPGLIVDEAAGGGLFGDRKLIWIDPVGNSFATAADALLGAPSTEFPVVAIAGALTKASKLLKLVEAHPEAVALVSYPPDARQLTRIVEQMIDDAGLEAQPGVAARLVELGAQNRDIIAREVEKMALYCGEGGTVDDAVLDRIGAASGETQWMAVGDAAMDGDFAAVERALSDLSPSAIEATPLLRSLQRRIQQLVPMAARVAEGQSVGQVVESQGRALFWKDKPVVARLLGKWPAANLGRLAQRVALAERRAMLEPGRRASMLGEELLAIARMAARAGR